MTIARFFDEDVVVRRLKDIDGTKSSLSSTATVDGHLQALDERAREQLGLIQEKALKAWFREDADVNEGDVIYDENENRYEVREVVIKDYGVNRHKECIIIQLNE